MLFPGKCLANYYSDELVFWTSHIDSPFINTSRPGQNGRRFAGDTFKRIFVNENVRISNKISLKFVPKGPINNIPSLVQLMAWCRPGDKPLSEAMMASLPTHICVTRPQWLLMKWYQYQCVSIWWISYNEFFIYRESLLAFNQIDIFDNSSFIVGCVCLRSKPCKKIIVSSANRIGVV